MAKIAIIYGSTTGNTQDAAERISSTLGAEEPMAVDKEVLAKAVDYDILLFGSSTWGFGDLQDNWESVAADLGSMDLKGKKVGFFGTGDQEGYGDTFVDAMGLLYDFLSGTGAEFIGAWPADGYEFTESRAVHDGVFVGLALDEDNQADLTEGRISEWCGLISDS